MLSPLPLPEFKTGPFSTEELRRALSTTKSNRAMGVDQVPAELLKCQEIEGELLSIIYPQQPSLRVKKETSMLGMACTVHNSCA